MLTTDNSSSKNNTNNTNGKSKLTTEQTAIIVTAIGAAGYVMNKPVSMLAAKIIKPGQ